MSTEEHFVSPIQGLFWLKLVQEKGISQLQQWIHWRNQCMWGTMRHQQSPGAVLRKLASWHGMLYLGLLMLGREAWAQNCSVEAGVRVSNSKEMAQALTDESVGCIVLTGNLTSAAK